MNQALVTLLLLLLCGPAMAQRTSAIISGEVKDAQEAVVPSVFIVVRNLETELIREGRTDDLGHYRLSGLPSGIYEVKAEAPGFQTEVKTGLSLTVAEELVLDFALRVGEFKEELTVVEQPVHLGLRSATIDALVSERQVRDLPLNGRDITQLILLQKGVVESRGSTRDINVGFGKKVSVSGSRPNQNLFIIDGTDANDALNNTPAAATGQVTGVETIKEFRVMTNTMSAEFGRVAGGVFNIVSRSGTNKLHGSVFSFHRNDNLDARNFFDAEKPEFKRNQFGFTLGGPIVPSRTFYFGSYEGLRESKGVTQVAFVPGLAIRRAPAGSEIHFPASGKTAVLSPSALPLLNLYPSPTGPEVVPGTHVAEYRGVLNRFADEDFFTARIDHYFSKSDSLFARYLYTDSEFLVPVLFPEFPNLDANRRQIFTLGESHVFDANTVNEFLFGFSRSTPSELVPTPSADKNIALIVGKDLGSIRVTSGDGLPGLTEVGTDRTNPKKFSNNTFQVSDNLFVNRGRHGLKMGSLFERFQFNGASETRTRGRLEFRSLFRLISDDPRRLEGASARSDFTRGYRQSLLGLYLQDDIRVTPAFTVFAGIRWEFVTTPNEVNGKISNLSDFLDPEAVVVVGDERFADPTAEVPSTCCRPLFDNPTLGNVSPRLGIAWDLAGRHRTVLRAGFGLFYEQPLFHVFRNPVFRSLPFVERARINSGDWPGGATIAALPLSPGLFSSPGAGQTTEAFQFDLERTYVMQYNLHLQQEVGMNTVASFGYVGSRGVNLFGRGDTNLAVPEIRPDGSEFFSDNERRNPDFDSVRTVYQGFNSWYNSLQMGFVRRERDGLSLQGSYTFSRCIDERSGTGGRQEQRFGQARTFDPFHRGRDKGLCDFHVQHAFVLNHIYPLPSRDNWKGLSAVLLKNWHINGILNLASGIPFNAFIEGDPDNDGSDDNGARPNLVGDPLSGQCPGGKGVGSPDCWFNPLAFAFPGTGVRGNLGRNTLLGPGVAIYDLALTKRARLNERLLIEFRAELFNLLNHTNLNPPANTEDGARIFSEDGSLDPTGAVISERSGTATSSREIQFGLRFVF